MIRRRQMMAQHGGGGLPSEYQAVEYLEGTGTQWIQLPFGFNNDAEIEMKAKLGTTGVDKFLIAPSIWNNKANRFAMCGIVVRGVLGCGYGNVATSSSALVPDLRSVDYMSIPLIHTYKNKIFQSEESTFDATFVTFGGTTYPLRLFYGYNSTTPGWIYYFDYKDSQNEASLVPCYRKADNEAGMYDLINNVFYVNAGTGTFIVGGDV